MRKNSGDRKRAYVMVVVVAGLLLGFLALPVILLAQMKVPEDLTMTETGSALSVVFSHKKHVVEREQKCNACHVKLFQMKAGKTAKKQGKLTMAAMAEGKFCGACHDGEQAFGVKAEAQQCGSCHVKK